MQAGSTPSHTKARGDDRGPATILVVEDEDSLRALIARMLAAEGYVTLTATDGRDALRVLAEHEGSVDLVVIDMVMPVMDGGHLAAELLRRTPGQRILCMSAYAPSELSDLGLESPDAPFLRKPFMPAQLYRQVRIALAAIPEAS